MLSDSSRKHSMFVVLLVLFLDLVGFSIVIPMFAEMLKFYGSLDEGLLVELNGFLAKTFDISEPGRHAAFFGGVLAGLYSMMQFLVIPFWGGLSDRHGRRPMLIASVCINLAGYVIWVFSGSFVLFVLSRIVCGFGSGNISIASAAVADLSDQKNRARAMGMMGAAIGLGFLIGPGLGATYGLMPHLAEPGAPGWGLNPFSFPAAIAAALTLLNLWLLLTRFRETLPPEKRGHAEATRSINPARLFGANLGARVRRMNLAYLLFMIGFAGFEGTLVFLAADKLQWGPGAVGGCMVWLGFVSIMVQGGLVRRLVARTGEKALTLLGMALLVPGFGLTALVAWSPQAWLLLLGCTLLALGVGFVSPTLSALVSLAAPRTAQGVAMGSFRSVGALGRAIGPLLAATLYFSFGAGAPYVLGAVLGLLPFLMLLGLKAPEHGAATDPPPIV